MIMTPGKSDDIRIGIELHNVTATVEGDPNRPNGATARWKSDLIAARLGKAFGGKGRDGRFE
jgi:hypothetical protein